MNRVRSPTKRLGPRKQQARRTRAENLVTLRVARGGGGAVIDWLPEMVR